MTTFRISRKHLVYYQKNLTWGKTHLNMGSSIHYAFGALNEQKERWVSEHQHSLLSAPEPWSRMRSAASQAVCVSLLKPWAKTDSSSLSCHSRETRHHIWSRGSPKLSTKHVASRVLKLTMVRQELVRTQFFCPGIRLYSFCAFI